VMHTSLGILKSQADFEEVEYPSRAPSARSP
jgi:hypothetical protein